jgi:hypothetical protein
MINRRRISWLYTRGDDSVFIIELAPLQLGVCGPGLERQVCAFRDGDELFAFNQQQTNALVAAGFRFQGFAVDRRNGTDRRRVTRTPRDRRAP